MLFNKKRELIEEIKKEWKYHKGSLTIYLYSSFFGLTLMLIALVAYKQNIQLSGDILQLISVISLGASFISIEWHLSNIIRKEEEKKYAIPQL